MSIGLLGRKVGMTQIFTEEGDAIPVTVVEMAPNTVVRVKREDGPDGYNAVLLGYGEANTKRLKRPRAGLFEKAGVEPTRFLREARVDTTDELEGIEAGGTLDVSRFAAGQRVDVIGTTKGRGFTGVIKRHNFSQPKMTHGTHEAFRHGGSLGNATTPGRVVKGRKMAGRYGNERVTIQNIKVVRVEPEHNLLVLKGGLPGPNGRLIYVQPAAKASK